MVCVRGDLWFVFFFQSLSGAAIKVFSDNCSKLSMDYFSSEMPQGKVWRKKAGRLTSQLFYNWILCETNIQRQFMWNDDSNFMHSNFMWTSILCTCSWVHMQHFHLKLVHLVFKWIHAKSDTYMQNTWKKEEWQCKERNLCRVFWFVLPEWPTNGPSLIWFSSLGGDCLSCREWISKPTLFTILEFFFL